MLIHVKRSNISHCFGLPPMDSAFPSDGSGFHQITLGFHQTTLGFRQTTLHFFKLLWVSSSYFAFFLSNYSGFSSTTLYFFNQIWVFIKVLCIFLTTLGSHQTALVFIKLCMDFSNYFGFLLILSSWGLNQSKSTEKKWL